MPAAGAAVPLRLPVMYPIGFFKGSEDTYAKFLTQGNKWQIESFTDPANKTIFINPAATAELGGSKARVTSIFRYDCMDGKDGFKGEVQANTDELWNVTGACYKTVDGKEHRLIGQWGFGARNQEGIRRIPFGGEAAAFKDVKSVPIRVGYRLTADNFQAQAEVDHTMAWQANAIVSLHDNNAAFGFKVESSKEGPKVDVGVGMRKPDVVQTYLKLTTGGGFQGRKASLMLHPLVCPKKLLGFSCVAKVNADVDKQLLGDVGVTVAHACPILKGYDWKVNVTKKGNKMSSFAAVTTKLPGKWTLGFGFGFADTNKTSLSDMNFGLRLTQGSTPLPL